MFTKQPRPCPKCGKSQNYGAFLPRPELATRPLGRLLPDSAYGPGYEGPPIQVGTPIVPADVECECGAVLRYKVRLDGTGWAWVAGRS